MLRLVSFDWAVRACDEASKAAGQEKVPFARTTGDDLGVWVMVPVQRIEGVLCLPCISNGALRFCCSPQVLTDWIGVTRSIFVKK